MSNPDIFALRKSQAGMRFIAQMTIYNSENSERLRQFIADSYHDEQLQAQSVEARLTALQAFYAEVGKVRVKQVLATHEHQVMIAIETQQDDRFFLVELKVEEDYPHRITGYMVLPLREVQTQDENDPDSAGA